MTEQVVEKKKRGRPSKKSVKTTEAPGVLTQAVNLEDVVSVVSALAKQVENLAAKVDSKDAIMGTPLETVDVTATETEPVTKPTTNTLKPKVHASNQPGVEAPMAPDKARELEAKIRLRNQGVDVMADSHREKAVQSYERLKRHIGSPDSKKKGHDEEKEIIDFLKEDPDNQETITTINAMTDMQLLAKYADTAYSRGKQGMTKLFRNRIKELDLEEAVV